MRRAFAIIPAALLLTGCAALMNSDRPTYNGPIRQPLWHTAGISVDQSPVIFDGAVYAIGRPFTKPDFPRVYAFDLPTGKPLWTADFLAERILLAAGENLFVAETEDHMHVLDLKTGAQAANQTPFAEAAAYPGANSDTLFTASRNRIWWVPLTGPHRTSLWQAATHVAQPMKPVIAGPNVYVYGNTPSSVLDNTIGLAALLAFDAKTGTLRWKWDVTSKTALLMCEGLAADESHAYLWLHDTSHTTFGNGLLLAFDAATGEEEWRHATAQYAIAEGPHLLSPNLVLIPDTPTGKEANSTSSGYLYLALDRATGATLWQSQTPWKYEHSVLSGDLLAASDHKVHDVLNENNDISPDSWVSALSLRTGKELWRSPTVELVAFTAPAAAEGMVAVGSKPFLRQDAPHQGKQSDAGVYVWALTP